MCDKDILYQVVYPAEMMYVEKIIANVETSLGDILNNRQNMQLQLVLEEIIVNIVSYAYVDAINQERTIKLTVCRIGNSLEIEIRDFGFAYNPLDRELPDEQCDLENCGIGGLGIHFVRKIADVVDYKRIGNENVLMLTMYLQN